MTSNDNNNTQSTTAANKKTRTYEEIKTSIIKRFGDLRKDLVEAIQVLREQGMDIKAVRAKLIDDLVKSNIAGKTVLYEIINREFATNEQIKKMDEQYAAKLEKQRRAPEIMVTADGNSQAMQEVGSGDGDDDEDLSPSAIRERNGNNNFLDKNVKKANNQMLKNAPHVNKTELETSDDDDEEEDQLSVKTEYNVNYDNEPLKEHGNNILINDPDHIEQIKRLIELGKSVILVVDKNLVPESILTT